MRQIDHDPNERRGDGMWWLWWAAWALVAFGWATFLYAGIIDWQSVALGGFTCLVLASWATDITGNRIPGSTGSNEERRQRQDW